MIGNFHVRFLGGKGAVMPPTYSTIIGYFCVPTVSSWIIQAGGAGAYGQKVGGAGKMAGNGAAAVGGAVGGSVAGRIKKMF